MADDALRYIQVGELVRSMTEDPLPHDDSLAGQTVSLAAEDGTLTRLVFSADGGLDWEIAGGPWASRRGREECRITRPRPGLFAVDYLAAAERATSVTIVLDLEHGAATTVSGTLPTADQAARSAFALATAGDELTSVSADIVPSFIDAPWQVARTRMSPPPTSSASARSTCTHGRKPTNTST